jgi:hypothetical protein
MYVERNIVQPLLRWKSEMYYIFGVWVCSLELHEMLMRHIIFSVARLALPYYSTLSPERHDFRNVF